MGSIFGDQEKTLFQEFQSALRRPIIDKMEIDSVVEKMRAVTAKVSEVNRQLSIPDQFF